MSIPSLVIVLTSTQLNTPPLFLRSVDGDCFLVAAWAQAPLWSWLQLPASGAADFDLLTSAESCSYSYTSSAHINPPLSSSSLSLLLGDADTLHMAGTGGRRGRGGRSPSGLLQAWAHSVTYSRHTLTAEFKHIVLQQSLHAWMLCGL